MLENFYFENSGISFESEVTEVIGTICEQSWGKTSFRYSSTKEDRYKGTDFWVLGVPVDVTLDIDRSSHTTLCKNEVEFDLGSFVFGVRTGNNYGTFEQPVLVIGVKSNLYISIKNYIDVVGFMKPKLKEVLEMGMDEYWNCVD